MQAVLDDQAVVFQFNCWIRAFFNGCIEVLLQLNGLPVDGVFPCRKDFFILVVCEHFLSQGISDLIAVAFGDLDIVVSNA